MVECIKIRLCMMKICLRIAAVLGSHFRTQKTAVLTHLLIPVGCERGLGCFNHTKEYSKYQPIHLTNCDSLQELNCF